MSRMAGHITEVRLGAFKSHREVVIPSSGARWGDGFDAAILLEVRRFRERVDLPSGRIVRLWSSDRALMAYA